MVFQIELTDPYDKVGLIIDLKNKNVAPCSKREDLSSRI
jgi:hypothetical protein